MGKRHGQIQFLVKLLVFHCDASATPLRLAASAKVREDHHDQMRRKPNIVIPQVLIKYRSISKPAEQTPQAPNRPTAAPSSPETTPETKPNTPASQTAVQKAKTAKNKSPSYGENLLSTVWCQGRSAYQQIRSIRPAEFSASYIAFTP